MLTTVVLADCSVVTSVPFAELVKVAFCHGNAVVWKIVSAPTPSAMRCARRMQCQGAHSITACSAISTHQSVHDAARLLFIK